MNPFIETGVLIGATIVVGITLLFVPVPRQKPPEIDKPPVAAPPPPPSPQEAVAPTPALIITAPITAPALSEKEHLANIEEKLRHIAAQVQRMEKKVE